MNSEPQGFFRGGEFTRLVVLLALVVVGWIVILNSYRQPPVRPPAPKAVAGGVPLPPPDESEEFQGILDKTRMTMRDNPAYLKLLERVRATSAEELASQSRRDVRFSQLLENPGRYRGLPIHVDGTARRILHQEVPGSKLFPKGHYYEAYVTTTDSQRFPYTLVFEDLPEGMPIGDELKEHVVFDGYFLKLMAYLAGDTSRFAPLLIGRLQWLDQPATPPPPKPGGGLGRLSGWSLLLMGAFLLYVVFRWSTYLRRAFAPSRPSRPHRPFVQDQIEPEALAEWLQSSEGEAEEPETH